MTVHAVIVPGEEEEAAVANPGAQPANADSSDQGPARSRVSKRSRDGGKEGRTDIRQGRKERFVDWAHDPDPPTAVHDHATRQRRQWWPTAARSH